jgi:hypothetical protein
MGRIRTIKPELPMSRSMGNVSRDARLCFVFLWTLVDDSGRFHADPRILAGQLYPYDADALELLPNWLAELEREGCIARYEVGGVPYLRIVNWLKHQKIDHPSKPVFPDPGGQPGSDPAEVLGEGSRGRREDSARARARPVPVPVPVPVPAPAPPEGGRSAKVPVPVPEPSLDSREHGQPNGTASLAAPDRGAASRAEATAKATTTATAKTKAAYERARARGMLHYPAVIEVAGKLFAENSHRPLHLNPLTELKARIGMDDGERKYSDLLGAAEIAVTNYVAANPVDPDWIALWRDFDKWVIATPASPNSPPSEPPLAEPRDDLQKALANASAEMQMEKASQSRTGSFPEQQTYDRAPRAAPTRKSNVES